jgi:hypothetical protein
MTMTATTADVTAATGSIVTQTTTTDVLTAAATATTTMTTTAAITAEDFIAIRSTGTVASIGAIGTTTGTGSLIGATVAERSLLLENKKHPEAAFTSGCFFCGFVSHGDRDHLRRRQLLNSVANLSLIKGKAAHIDLSRLTEYQ